MGSPRPNCWNVGDRLKYGDSMIIKSSLPRQNGRHFEDDIFRGQDNAWYWLHKIINSLSPSHAYVRQ